jgi:hypothetical protein
MEKGRRSGERLSYWAGLLSWGMESVMRRELEMAREFAVKTLAVETGNMAMAAAFKSHPSAKNAEEWGTRLKSHPSARNAEGWGSRLFWWAAMLLLVILPSALWAQGPALTTVNGTVYRADGTAAAGTVLISWPSFQTAEGDVVAAGNLAVTIGAQGAFTAQLAPNVGATPAGTYYVVVLQLDDGTVRTEYWAVPATSPTTIAAVETTPGTGLGNLAVTEQYVNGAVADRALDASVVHLAGGETITGTKQFSVPPSLPAPAGANDATNKNYVDTAVANAGAGSYVAKAGDTMTGPLTLPGNPTAPNQAADRQYVDSGLGVKADLTNGTVPTGELGTGVASAGTCLNGNSTWGSCGGGAPAGITYATTALNWSQTISSALTGGTRATVTLTPCPTGVDTTSGAGYQVLLTGGGNRETVNVGSASGGCVSGGTSGTITFTPFYSYAAGYTIGSASSGIQETLNASCGVSGTASLNSACNVTIPANGPNGSINTYNVYGTIYLHANQTILSGYGTSLNCLGRGACIQIGDLNNATDYKDNTVAGLSFRSPVNVTGTPAFAGVGITLTQQASQAVTITTASAHGFRIGDMVTILFTDDRSYWGDAVVTAVPSSTTFQYSRAGSNIATQATPGVVALAYVAVLDNGFGSHLIDLAYDFANEAGAFNNFFDLWDDENVTIDHFNNQAISLNDSATWTGSFLFSAGNQGHQIAPVITLRDSTITANYSNGITVYNSNGLYVENTVLEATGPWQVYSANYTGNYQGAYLKNIYSESGNSLNPLAPPRSPFPGLGIAGLIAGYSSGGASFEIAGSGTLGAFATGGAGSTAYSYFVVANDTTAGTQTSPMQVLNWLSTGSDSIPVRWPRVASGTDVITYDLIRVATPRGIGQNAPYPYTGGCTGGTGGTCGYVVQGLSQSAACSGGLVCSYTDNGGGSTSAYGTNPSQYPKQGTYLGQLIFWPGSIVSVNKSVKVDAEEQNTVGVGLNGNPVQIADQCTSNGAPSAGGYTTCLASLTAPAGAGGANQAATLITDGANVSGGQALSKGRLNFSSTALSIFNPHHIITLVDSQPALTQATWGYRPAASANDVWIGTDGLASGINLNAAPLAFGSPVSITNYIAQTGDGVHANWLERLSAALKEFKVPVQFDQNVTLAGMANGCLNVASGVIGSTGSSCGTGGGGGSVSSVYGRTGAVVAASGDYSVAQVTGAAADSAVVHNTGNETIAGAKSFTGNVTASGNLILPQGNGYVPAAGGIGLDTVAGLPVVNIGGTTQQVALTSSNISGQAGTALALAAAPTQCSGSFATGIAANGNANCTTANMIQLAETSAPGDPPNYGVFWFDSTTHTPHAIDNNHVIQMGLTNLFNSDPGGDPLDNLEELNGSTAQNLRVYSNYVNNTAWTRMSLGSEAVGGTTYNVLRSEDATSGNALSLGMHIGSAIKWFFSSDGTFKPNSDGSYDIGTDTGQAMRSVFAKTSFNMYSTGRQDFEFPNDGTNGTTLNSLAVYNSSGSGVQTASTSSTDGVVGIVSGGAGTANKAVLTWAGLASCNFDAANPIAGDYVVASTTQAGKCHDSGSTSRPTGVQVIGRIDSGGVRVSLAPPSGGGGGNVASVFGRTGAITAGSGDYSVGQVTGAAADSAVVHLAGAETISGAKTFSSDVMLSGNLNVAGNINQTGTGPTQWSGTKWTGTTVTVPSGKDFSLGVGSDNTFKCQLASGASCMPSGATYPGAGIANSTGSGWGSSYGTSGTGSTVALTASPVFTGSPTVPGYVPTGTTVNGHALSGNITVSASDVTTGTLPAGQLPTANCSWITVPTQSGSGNVFAGTNKAIVWGVYNPYPCVSNNVAYVVGTADNTANNYALGLYSGASGGTGTLIATTASTAGTSFAASAGIKHIAWNSANVVVPAGRVYIALTSSCASSCAALVGTPGTGVTWAANVQVSVGTGGAALPATVTLPADSFSSGASIPALIVY